MVYYVDMKDYNRHELLSFLDILDILYILDKYHILNTLQTVKTN